MFVESLSIKGLFEPEHQSRWPHLGPIAILLSILPIAILLSILLSILPIAILLSILPSILPSFRVLSISVVAIIRALASSPRPFVD